MKKIYWGKLALNVLKYAVTIVMAAIAGNEVL